MSKKMKNRLIDQCFADIEILDVAIARIEIPQINLAALEASVNARRALRKVADELRMVESILAE